MLFFFVLPQLISFFLILFRKKVGYYLIMLSALTDYILLSVFWEIMLSSNFEKQRLYDAVFISIYYLAIIILPIYQLKKPEIKF